MESVVCLTHRSREEDGCRIALPEADVRRHLPAISVPGDLAFIFELLGPSDALGKGGYCNAKRLAVICSLRMWKVFSFRLLYSE